MSRPPPAVLYAVAAAAVGGAVQFHDGEYHDTAGGKAAIALLTLAIVISTPSPLYSGERAGVRGVFRRSGEGERAGERPTSNVQRPTPKEEGENEDPHPGPLPEYREREQEGGRHGRWTAVLGLLLAIQFLVLLTHRPDSPEHSYLLPRGLAALGFYRAAVAAGAALTAAGVAGALLRPGPRVRLWFFPVLLIFSLLGGSVLAWTHRPGDDLTPHIDVFLFQQKAARTLLHGRNPYAIADYPDIYHGGTLDPATGRRRQEVYGPGMSDGRTLRFGFPYLPMSLYLATAGYAAAGDYRFAQGAALLVSAVLLYAARPGMRSALVALLLLSTPRAFFVLISGWTEPLLVLWLAAAVWCAIRRPGLLPVALGLLLATKQYLLLALPLTVLLVPRGDGLRGLAPRWRDWLRLLLWTGAVAAAVTLPLALWDWRRFCFSAFTVQRYAPFRWDALSYLTWRAFGHGPPSDRETVLLPGAAVVATTALCLWRSPRTAAGFAGAIGLVLLAFFAFGKQAFANYYFFVIGAFCCAAAASPAGGSASRPTS